MNGENRLQVIDEPVELKKKNQLKFKTSWKITDLFRGIYRIYLELIKKK
jgi:hypothetical protein